MALENFGTEIEAIQHMALVLLDQNEQGVATLTLNDPNRRNAMGREMADEFRETVAILKRSTSLRSVIVTGAGKAFAAGGDLQMLKAKSELDRETNKRLMLEFYNSFLCLQTLSVPTIAAVNGHAIGAGLCVAMACDFRVISTSAKLGFTFTKLALHPGMGASLFVPRIAGVSVATDLLVSGRVFSADEAKQMGLVQDVVASDQVLLSAKKIASDLLCTGPQAVAGLLKTLRPSSEELAKALEREADEQADGYSRAEFLEGVNATIEKRQAKFDQ